MISRESMMEKSEYRGKSEYFPESRNTNPNLCLNGRENEGMQHPNPVFVNNATNHFSFSYDNNKLTPTYPTWLPRPIHSTQTDMCLLATCNCCSQMSTSPPLESLLRHQAFKTYALPPLSTGQVKMLMESPMYPLESLRKNMSPTLPTMTTILNQS